jgi:hypothetical protein
MDEETYQRMPESIEVRQVQVQVQVHQRGFRTRSLIVVTTLLDGQEYTQEELAELYRRRWLAELYIRTIKITLGMDVLRCRTPEMVRREMWTCLLAYNLVRRTMLQASATSGAAKPPRELSFAAGMQAIAAGWTTMPLLDESRRSKVIDVHLENLARQQVGDRPNRVEPRAIKRRPKPHHLLRKPRAQAGGAAGGGGVRRFTASGSVIRS